jgi:hydrogenase maturation protease
MQSTIKVIGFGSHQGDDQAGWIVAEKLRGRADLGVQVVTLCDPTRLLEECDDCDLLILIDACVSGGTPGKVQRLKWPSAAVHYDRYTSTHGVTIDDVLQLAERLGRLPRQVVMFVIEGAQFSPSGSPSAALLAGLTKLEAMVLAELALPRNHAEQDSHCHA